MVKEEELVNANQPTEDDDDNDSEDEDAYDGNGVPGWGHVDRLAEKLVKLTGLSVNKEDASEIVHLYTKLDRFDKEPLAFRRKKPRRPLSGLFDRTKRGHADVEAMKR